MLPPERVLKTDSFVSEVIGVLLVRCTIGIIGLQAQALLPCSYGICQQCMRLDQMRSISIEKGTAELGWLGRPQDGQAKSDAHSLAWVQWSASHSCFGWFTLPVSECKGCVHSRCTHHLPGDVPLRKAKSQVIGKYTAGDGGSG